MPAMRDSTVFFLAKGAHIPDSRGHEGLRHEMEVVAHPQSVRAGEPMEIQVRVENVGQAKWLHENIAGIGVVKLGAHLLDPDYRLLDNDFARGEFETDIEPGQAVTGKLQVTFSEPGEYLLAIDLVSERVTWFEPMGSQPQYLRVSVT